MEKLKELEEKLGYVFADRTLLKRALTHSSYVNEHQMGKDECNERLEFLGDAVLELVSSDYLFSRYPQKPEGLLSRIRASIVCEQTLALCARDISLGDYLLLGRGEEMGGGRLRNSVTSDAFEAVIGAIYLDGGFAGAKEFVLRAVFSDIDKKQLFFDSKTILQEIIQTDPKNVLSYELLREMGPDHNKSFEVRAMLSGREIGRGTGHTKKAAEAMAAYVGIRTLGKDGGSAGCI